MQDNRRLLKEVNRLYSQQYNKLNILDNDYLIYLNESNTHLVHAIIKAPYDSVYRHKFIRLDLTIPNDYPHSPPSVKFINKDSVRIHPNMYEDGKCCATILNTWPSDNEKWTSSMGIETILIMFHSFLDNNPYKFEPGGRDDHTYTDYVLHQSWKTCLFDYLDDYNQPEIFVEFIHKYILKNINKIYRELKSLSFEYPLDYYETNCFEIELFIIDYSEILRTMEYHYRKIVLGSSMSLDYINNDYTNSDDDDDDDDDNVFSNLQHQCDICFDTLEIKDNIIKLTCSHNFHISCIKNHIQSNGQICSICRQDISLNISDLDNNDDDDDVLSDDNTSNTSSKTIYVINPETNRKIKVGGKTYNMLIDLGYDF
jgi:ubiquitin-protein ligase